MEHIRKVHIEKKRIYGLDILRCIAILSVLVSHAFFLYPLKISNYLVKYSVDGVSFFFVLSGFLVGGILIKTIEREKLSFRVMLHFWSRRWFRTLPNYFLVLILLTVLHLVLKPNVSILTIKNYFVFSQNLFSPHPYQFFPEAWSLSVEEWFYIIVPICIFGLIILFNLKNQSSLIITALAIIILITGFRGYRYFHLTTHDLMSWSMTFRNQVSTRLDSLMYGVIGAYLSYYHHKIWFKYKNLSLVVGCLLLLVQFYYQINTNFGLYFCVFSFSLNSIGTLLLLPFLSNLKNGEGLVYKVVTHISLISYSMYLLNFSLVLRWLLNNIHLTPAYELPVKHVLFWVITITLSSICYKYYELPMTRLRDRRSRRRALGVVGEPEFAVANNIITR